MLDARSAPVLGCCHGIDLETAAWFAPAGVTKDEQSKMRVPHTAANCRFCLVQVASALCASYIGGSVNFAAVSQSLGLAPGPLLAASMAADNIAMAAYLTAIMIIPAKNMIDSAHRPPTVAAAAAGGVKSATEASSHQHHARDVVMGQSAQTATSMT